MKNKSAFSKKGNIIHYDPITDLDGIAHVRNQMIRGNYPASISDCEVIGIHGDCGIECPVFINGECQADEPPKEGG